MNKVTVGLAAVLLAGCGGSAATTAVESRTIEGVFILHNESVWTGDTCRGDEGYADIQRGLQATLTDEDGTVIGTAAFPVGETVERTQCQFTYEFSDVPEADFYTVAIGRRGELTYSFTEMEAMDWRIASELGR